MGCAPSTGKASSVAPGKYDESVAVSVTAKTNGAAGGAGGAGGGGGGASDAADDAANATCDLFIIHFNDGAFQKSPFCCAVKLRCSTSAGWGNEHGL